MFNLFRNRKLERNLHVDESEERFRKQLDETPLEKNDIPAMIIAAFLVLLPAVLVTFGLLVLLMYLFFFH